MQRREFHPGDDLGACAGAVLCRDAVLTTPQGTITLRRGMLLADALVQTPPDLSVRFHILVPDTGDVGQDRGSQMIAQAVAGDGVMLSPPHQGQVNLRAKQPGLLRVDQVALRQLNAHGVALVATALDGRVVAADDVVAIAKAAGLFVSRHDLHAALAGVNTPLLRVAPFVVRRVAFLVSERIRAANRDRASGHLRAALHRFGAELVAVQSVPDDPDAVATTYRALLADGCELVLVAGSIMLDPDDPFLQALPHVDARLVRAGAPLDPGTMFWVAYAGTVPFLGLASCELYGRTSVLDLVLPYALARESITAPLLADFGYGGLLGSTIQARRPDRPA